jgi:hypothetical protein
MTEIYVVDIKLASILASFGIPRRQSDPVTCEVRTEDGIRKEQFKFWFSLRTDEHRADARQYIEAYTKSRNWEELTLDEDHLLYWMKGVLENRESYLTEIKKNVAPIKIITIGNKTLLIGERASQELKDKIKKLL